MWLEFLVDEKLLLVAGNGEGKEEFDVFIWVEMVVETSHLSVCK